jgi:hypothetical protein
MISDRVGFTVETREGVGSIHISDARLDAAPQVLD